MSIYDQKPWLKNYPPWISSNYEVPQENLVQIFKRLASRSGSEPAIYYFNRLISYGEVDKWSDNLAAALQDLGLQKGERVVFYMQNIPQFVIAQYAVWKAGGIVVPLNPMFKEKELEYYFRDSGAKMLITLGSTYEAVAKNVVEHLNIGPVISTSGLDFFPPAEPVPKVLQDETSRKFPGTFDFLDLLKQYEHRMPLPMLLAPQGPAYFTYTSGTTGPPKGAMNTHENIVFNALLYTIFLNLDFQDVILGVAPLFHVTGQVAHLACAAYAGIPVILFFRFDPEEALKLIERWKATMTVGSITVFISLMNHPDIKKRDFSTMKKVFSGGAPVSPAIVENFEKTCGAYIHNIYGLTETTSPSHLTPLGTRLPVDPVTGALSVGLPAPNTIAKIVDLEKGEEELPPGEVGEIVIKGPMVIPGYWNKPEETAHAIRNGWLYTGDVGKMDEDGWFYIVDRKKDLIIVSGYKVWPRDVEDVLYQHPGVKEAAVIGVPDSYRGETVKAFVALKEDFKDRVTPEELSNFCKKRMAAYKYPRIVEIVPEIPKTVTGKFLRRALREEEKAKSKK
ncbi:MAG: long-chain fatty acid--CoA ligase [Deltaproteobacteria bacterium]|nr:long-chain fatty acid--CoA ligase [Deltaproteobacteria bacterium]